MAAFIKKMFDILKRGEKKRYPNRKITESECLHYNILFERSIKIKISKKNEKQ